MSKSKDMESSTDVHPTAKQREIGHELISITAKNATQTNNLIIELAMTLFSSTSKYAVMQQASAVLWTKQTGDYADSTPRNEYIYDMCVEFGGTVYTSLLDSRNAIKKSNEKTAESSDFASLHEQITQINDRMKEAVRCVSGLMSLRNLGATNIHIQASTTTVYKSVQCQMPSGEFKSYNKSGIRKLAIESPQTDAQRRKVAMSNARNQLLEYAILKLMSVLVDKTGKVGTLTDVTSITEQGMLVRLYQTLNLFMRDQESLIEKYSLEDEAVSKALVTAKDIRKQDALAAAQEQVA